MSQTTDFIAKITEKLRHDRELRLDISHELQTHLDEAIDEYKASDYDEEAAITQAIKDMGDAEELADDLWQSNRFRMKLRAWCWWIARLSLWPACVLVTFGFIITGLSHVGMLQHSGEYGEVPDTGRFNPIHLTSKLIEEHMRSRMSPAQRLIAFGDEKASDQIQCWKALRDAFPDEPLYQLKYIGTLINTANNEKKPENKLVLDELQRGRKLDPDNGVYDLIEASLLIRDVKFVEDAKQSLVFPALRNKPTSDPNEPHHPYCFESPQSLDEMKQAISLLERAVYHPYITLHMMDMQRLRMAQLPAARSMQEYFIRVTRVQGVYLPPLANSRRLARYIGAAALQQAYKGDGKSAIQWLELSDHWQRKMAADSDTVIKLMVVRSILSLNLYYRAFVYDALGDAQAATKAMQAYADAAKEYDQVMNRFRMTDEMKEKRKHSGAMLGMLLEVIPSYKIDPTPFRLGEYAVMDRALLTTLLLSFLFVGSLLMLSGAIRVRFAKSTAKRPLLLWVGFKRLGKVIGTSVCLPVLVFVGLLQTPLFGRQWGLDQNMGSLVWYLPLFVGMWLLLCYLGIEAMRQRALELGMPVPGRLSRWWLVWMLLVGGTALLLPFVMLKVSFEYEKHRWDATQVLIGLWVLEIAVCVLVWLLMTCFIAWVRGINRWFKVGFCSLCEGMGAMLLLGAAFAVVIGYRVAPHDLKAYVAGVFLVCVPVGFALSLARLAGKGNHYPLFLSSITRTLPVFMMLCILFLAVVAGQALQWQERYYANQMQGQSLIFMDLEVQRSDASVLRRPWAGDEMTPPMMVPKQNIQ